MARRSPHRVAPVTEACILLAPHGLPAVVRQALDDVSLPPVARLMMWHLAGRLDFVELRELKVASLAHEMKVKERRAARALSTLVARGYLRCDRRRAPALSRYALPWSRAAARARAA